MIRSYRELLVWQKAKSLAVHIYSATESFPRTETYGLTSQARRAAVSVISNIAEGQGRLTSGEFLHFLGLARGSLMELEAQFAIALDLKYLSGYTQSSWAGALSGLGTAKSVDRGHSPQTRGMTTLSLCHLATLKPQ